MTTSTVHRTCTALAYRLRSDRSHEVEDQCLDKIHFTKPSSIFEVLEVILYISFETGTSFEINKMPSFHDRNFFSKLVSNMAKSIQIFYEFF